MRGFLKLAADKRKDVAAGCGALTSVSTDTTGLDITKMVGGLPPVPPARVELSVVGAAPEVTDETVRLFLGWMDGAFVGTPEAMRMAVKQAMTNALAGKESPYA